MVVSFLPVRSGCLILLALILELQTAKVNSKNMDIPPGETDKLCEIFTKMDGFFVSASQFANIWYLQIFWKELETARKRRFTNTAVSATIAVYQNEEGIPI